MDSIGMNPKEVELSEIIMLPLMYVHMVRAGVNNRQISSEIQAQNKILSATSDDF